ncbi:MAG TPA: maltotransferase domain-containing protein, partial [Terracidiphilus sp.]|nr:maltotransferase domain-containing protein [Terracidiphilus sp.]
MIKPVNGRSRVVIEEIEPRVNAGRHPARRVLEDEVMVRAAIFADGHDQVRARLLYKHSTERRWRFVPMISGVNDAWSGSFTVDRLGMWNYSIVAWVDHFTTWLSDLRKRLDAQPATASIAVADAPGPLASGGLQAGAQTTSGDVALALRTGAILLEHAASRARGADTRKLSEAASTLTALAEENRPFYDFPLTQQQIDLAE